MKLRHWLLLCALLLTAPFAAKAQTAAIKTNLVGWALTNVNLGVEVGVARQHTVQLTGSLNPWNFSDDRHFRNWNVMPEYRYWFCEKFNGHFIGVHLLGGQYNAKNVNFPLKALIVASSVTPQDVADDPASAQKGWPDLTGDNSGRHAEGWYGGAGFTYGYQWMLSKHWNVEASLGVGYAYSSLKFYGRCKKTIDKRSLHYVGPTHANISFMYLF
ncbi:DUF3575 domain-containing protein [Faecalibaculum rodentium]|uniref:DUF3575 domain-containing protein n=1 Tax=Faecalibaculum rodentium TaxID=1702221 RepID=UPI0025AE45BE|nr:DUF3575 domain-containing protein [Faecalibaculum rodentium]